MNVAISIIAQPPLFNKIKKGKQEPVFSARTTIALEEYLTNRRWKIHTCLLNERPLPGSPAKVSNVSCQEFRRS